MKEAVPAVLAKVIGGGPALSIMGTVLIAAGSILWHTSSEISAQGVELAEQGRTIAVLSQKWDEQDSKVQGIAIGVAQLQGGMATLNQKMDDQIRSNRSNR